MGVNEIEDAKVLFVFGYNGADSHPIVARQIVRAKEKGATIICGDPRITETARIADIHLQLKGGTNLLLVNAFAHVIIEEGLCDEAFIAEHSVDFEAFKEAVKDITPENTEAQTTVPAELVRKAARLYAKSGQSMILYGMGVCQFGQAVDVVKSLANLCIMTGNLGRHAVGIGPVRGQNNVQGACDMGALPNNYPGYQAVNNPDIQKKFEKAWGVESLNPNPGIQISVVPDHVLKGEKPEIHAYYIMGEDPAQSDADLAEVREALEKIDFVILQDIYYNKTALYADVLLPATGWCEHDCTYSCCDRGFQHVRKIVEPKGDVKLDWVIICEIAKAMGAPSKWDYKDVQEIWAEIISLVPNYAGATWEKIDKYVNIQWPCKNPDDSDKGTLFLHKDGKCSNPDGKAKFFHTEYRPPMEMENKDFPLTLSTVREVGHYSVRTMTGNSRMLAALEDEPGWVEISPDDATPLGIKHGDIVKISSKRGHVLTRAKVTERVKKGAVYMTYQWWVGACNELTLANLDPVSKTPEYKYCACKVEALSDQKAAWAEVRKQYEKIRKEMHCDKAREVA